MRVLVLSWDARTDARGPTPQAAGLATALAAAGDLVRVVTRGGVDEAAGELDGAERCEVHAVVDAPPILPAELDEPLLAAEAFAARALAVGTRRLVASPADLVHAVGWQTGPVVAGLRRTHGVAVVATLGARDLDPTRDGGPAVATARQLAADADLVLAPTRHDADAVAATTGTPVEVVGPGIDLPPRQPGPPPARGPLHLVAPAGSAHREVASAIRGASDHPRRVTRSWRRRPFAVAVLDAHDLDAAARALALGVPLLAAAGPAGELATQTGGGLVVEPTGAAVAAAVARLVAEPSLAAALGEAGAAAAVELGWDRMATAWRTAVGRHLAFGAPHLHAAG